MTPPPIRIRIPKHENYVYYLYRGGPNQRWLLVSSNGVGHCLSTITRDVPMLRFALDDAGDDPEKALEAVRKHTHNSYGSIAELVS